MNVTEKNTWGYVDDLYSLLEISLYYRHRPIREPRRSFLPLTFRQPGNSFLRSKPLEENKSFYIWYKHISNMLMVRFQNVLIINDASFYSNVQIAGELSIYCRVWIRHHQLITIKKKKPGEKQPNHLTKPRAHVTPSLQMTAELTNRARCCFWKDFIYNIRTAWQPITTHVWPKGVLVEWANNEREQEQSPNPKLEGVFYCGLWCGRTFLNLKIEFVLPANTGTDGASIICCYNQLICLQCCIHVQIHVQTHWVFCSAAHNGSNVEKMGISLVHNEGFCP